MEYLSEYGRIAVMPSRLDNSPLTVIECLLGKIPFLAAYAGGIPELIHPEDQVGCLFAPNAADLAALLKRVFSQGAEVPRPAFDVKESLHLHERFHACLASDYFGINKKVREIAKIDTQPNTVENPLVSVCLIHRNREQLLQQAIESLYRQTYENIEVILVDDDSTDEGSLRYLDKLEEEFFNRNWSLVRASVHSPAKARNIAACTAKGKYLILMDDDNVAMPNEIETFIRCAQFSDADILTCGYHALDMYDYPTETYLAKYQVSYLGDCQDAGLMTNVFGDTNSLFKRDIFLELGGFDDRYDYGREDHELFARAVLSGKALESIPDALFWYRTVGLRRKRFNEFSARYRIVQTYASFYPNEIGNLFRQILGYDLLASYKIVSSKSIKTNQMKQNQQANKANCNYVVVGEAESLETPDRYPFPSKTQRRIIALCKPFIKLFSRPEYYIKLCLAPSDTFATTRHPVLRCLGALLAKVGPRPKRSGYRTMKVLDGNA